MGCAEDLATRLGLDGQAVDHFDWAAVESSIGVTLPDDYKALVEKFPDGLFQGFVKLIRPGAVGSPRTEFLGYYAHRLDDMRTWREDEPKRFPYPIFPEPGGLLPWGVSHRAGLFFWLTEGDDPGNWPVVIAEPEFEHWTRYDGPVCAFLEDIVSGRFDGAPYDIDLARDPWFQPIAVDPPPSPVASGAGEFWLNHRSIGEQPHDETAALAELVPSTGTGRSVDWSALQQATGLALPSDYRTFMEDYGPGTLCDITIVDPVELPGLIERSYLKAVGNPKRIPEVDAPVYPEPGGMIPWGETPDGWTCCWAPLGPDPESWGTVLADPDLLGYQLHAGYSFSSLLLKYASAEGVGFALGRTTPWQGPAVFRPLT